MVRREKWETKHPNLSPAPARDGANQAGRREIDLRMVRYSVSLQAPVDLLGVYLSQSPSPVHSCKGELKLSLWSHNRRAVRVSRYPYPQRSNWRSDLILAQPFSSLPLTTLSVGNSLLKFGAQSPALSAPPRRAADENFYGHNYFNHLNIRKHTLSKNY